MMGEKVTLFGSRGVVCREFMGGLEGGDASEVLVVGGVDGGVGGKIMPRAFNSWDGRSWLLPVDGDAGS
jgi:hypothetical protein